MLIKMVWWHGRGLPPRRLGFVVYDWGGVSVAPPSSMRVLPAAVAESAKEVLAHADENRNVFAAAWLWAKPPLTLWRLVPTPVPRRRIIYFADWDKIYVSADGTLAVKWAATKCCTALLWSYPWTWVHSRRFVRMAVPVPAARARL